jgi:hypothetical protein
MIHSVISKKTELFITTGVRTSNPASVLAAKTIIYHKIM